MSNEVQKPPADSKAVTPWEEFKSNVERGPMGQELAKVLPPHISPEKFARTVLTAVQLNPKLLQANRSSLWNACVRCATDGLLPDNREAAFSIFNVNVAPRGQPAQWESHVVYLPMVAGILKKIRQSGELSTIAAHVVYENDGFVFHLGDEERIEHKPVLGERGKPIAAYAVATLTDGAKMREVMALADIEQVRAVSKAKDSGPWRDWWPEMAKKTVIRRLAKRLPMSTDLEQVLRRDDDLYDLAPAAIEKPPAHQPPETGRNRLDAFAERQQKRIDHQVETVAGMMPEDEPAETTQPAAAAPADPPPAPKNVVLMASASTTRGSSALQGRPAVNAPTRASASAQGPDWEKALAEAETSLSCCRTEVAVRAVENRMRSRFAGAPQQVLQQLEDLFEARLEEIGALVGAE